MRTVTQIEKHQNNAIKYEKEIQELINNTKIYEGIVNPVVSRDNSTVVKVEDINVIKSMCLHYTPDYKCAVLNHSCFKEPAPYYLKGAPGREEDLCYHSFYYNVLLGMTDYYKYNKKNLNKGLCINRGLYTEDVIFKDGNQSVNYAIISAQAPNKEGQIRYKRFTETENNEALKERLDFILNIAYLNKIDILILGAFGCSVYKQSPEFVAGCFKELINNKYKGVFKEIYFPIENSSHYEIFNNIF